jgi:uncharacterized membrane protein YraQ (UPF0718 family)
MSLWEFFSSQILGMKWLSDLVMKFIELFDISNERIADSIHFFLYDTIKIFILLCTLIFSISYIQSYFPPERTSRILGKIKGIKGNILGALFGTITPFCSCSSIPLFIGFTSSGLPVGVTFSFLISSPLVDLASVLILMSFFGAKIAIAYVVVGLVLAVIGGTLIDKLGLEKYVEPFILDMRDKQKNVIEDFSMTKRERVSFSWTQVKDIFNKVWIYVLGGVLIGAIIHNWIPAEFVQKVIGEGNPFGVLLAVLVGIPMYADIFGTLPIAEALFLSGVPVGTILSFMMAVTALSLPSIILISKVIKKKLIYFFVGYVSLGIIVIGYLFNIFL